MVPRRFGDSHGFLKLRTRRAAEHVLNTMNYVSIQGRSCRIQINGSHKASADCNVFVKNLQDGQVSPSSSPSPLPSSLAAAALSAGGAAGGDGAAIMGGGGAGTAAEPAIDNHRLHQIFSRYGPVASCKIVCDKQTGISKGFGFVLFTKSEDAAAAIAAMDGSPLFARGGEVLSVSLARQQQQQQQQQHPQHQHQHQHHRQHQHQHKQHKQQRQQGQQGPSPSSSSSSSSGNFRSFMKAG
eukprot:g1429.t1